MNPLDTLLRPVEMLLNRNVDASTAARELAAELKGKVVAIRIQDTALAMYFTFEPDCVVLASETDAEPDVVITGSLFTLARLATAPGDARFDPGTIDLTGNVEAARAFQRLLTHTRPDIEEELSGLIGDVAAHRIGLFAAGFRHWAVNARSTMAMNIREYLQEESRDLPTRFEVERFVRDVDTLRDDVERLAARIARLEGRS